jgi:hypothetical protein
MTNPPKTWKELNKRIEETNKRLREQLEWFKEHNKKEERTKNI